MIEFKHMSQAVSLFFLPPKRLQRLFILSLYNYFPRLKQPPPRQPQEPRIFFTASGQVFCQHFLPSIHPYPAGITILQQSGKIFPRKILTGIGSKVVVLIIRP
jgi:hypothetical protein